MQTRLLCTRCGDSIHRDTASRNDGLCMPCFRGNTLTLEERKARRESTRQIAEAWYASPEHQYWKKLVGKFYATDRGLDALTRGERLYFLITTLDGEVRNGGFSQFFSNSSGEHYEETVAALTDVDLHTAARLLQDAKAILFGSKRVPRDRMARWKAMPAADEDHPDHGSVNDELEQFDKRYYARNAEVMTALERVVTE
jgi:Domain of unknown function (DUF4375)